MENTEYRAKRFYQRKEVVDNYDALRFGSWNGCLAQELERRALEQVMRKYFGAGGCVFDLPCGTGRMIGLFQARGYDVVAGDISQEMLGFSRKRLMDLAANGQGKHKQREGSLSFVQVDAENLPFSDNSFDYLVSYRLMAHLPEPLCRKVLAEMLRVTRKAAVINYHLRSWAPLSVFNRLFRKHACPVSDISEEELRAEISRSYSNVEVCAARRLSWYERSSTLVVLRKK